MMLSEANRCAAELNADAVTEEDAVTEDPRDKLGNFHHLKLCSVDFHSSLSQLIFQDTVKRP